MVCYIQYIVLVLLIAAAEIAAGILGFLFRKQIVSVNIIICLCVLIFLLSSGIL